MTRILQRPSLNANAVALRAPPSWDPIALSAYEQGYSEGAGTMLEKGRRDLHRFETEIIDATQRCLHAVETARQLMARRTLDIAELFVTTALRDIPEAGTAGMLVRLGEVLRAFEPGPIELSVATDLVGELEAIMATRNDYADRVKVVDDPTLKPGEFRLHSEWADADGTFERYISAARAALEAHPADESR
ncbi:MAG: hypothetical protein K8R99_01215 [Actinomycetia bacterium]|nr:hypothetical protein [Actinomycetes bacterium]